MLGLVIGRVGARRVLAIVLAASAAVLAALSWLVGNHHVAGLDRRGFVLFGATKHGWLGAIAEPTANVGGTFYAVVALLAVAVLLRHRARLEAGVIVAGPLVCLVAARWAKHVEKRARPSGALIPAHAYSFPSTDAALAVGFLAIAIALARLTTDPLRRAAIIAGGALLTIAGGLLFVALRVHFLSDVIAGWALGVAAFAACALAGLTLAGRRAQ